MRRRSRPLPPTEAPHPRGEDLDLSSVMEVVRRLHEQDLAAVHAVGRVLPDVAALAEAAFQSLKAGGRLVYVGAGTSGRLGVLDAAECPPTFGTNPKQVVALLAGGAAAMLRAAEGSEDDAGEGARAIRRIRVEAADLVCGISASGMTPFVRGALDESRKSGAKTALVCCNRELDSAAADLLVVVDTGPELIAGSTRLKAGTATKLVLNAVSTAAMVAMGKVYRGRMVELLPTNGKLASRARRMVAELAGLPEAAASKLLDRAGGSPKVALAMHFTGLGRAAAERALQTASLRALERRSRTRRRQAG